MKRQSLSLIVLTSVFSVLFAPRGIFPAERRPEGFLQIFCRRFQQNDPGIPPRIFRKLEGPLKKAVQDGRGNRWQATRQGLLQTNVLGRTKLWTAQDGLPIVALTGIAASPDGRLWLATRQGAICFEPDQPSRDRWYYFWGRRYLADNQVENIAAIPGGAWIRTLAGISKIEFKPFDFQRKSRLFVDRLQRRHNRYGLVADCDLVRPGDAASYRLRPNDNDGLWTAIYVSAECFRFAATHSREALRNARTSLRALFQLESITGIPGFPARSFARRGDFREAGGEWHRTPDGKWEWEGDTSSDELVGHFFAYSVAYDLLPDEADRQAIRPVVSRIAGHLLDRGLKLVGYAGRVTRWGNYTAEYFKTPEGREDEALDSLELLSHLKVAAHVTGEQRFRTAYQHIAEQLGYASNVEKFATDTPREVNYSDEELAFLSFYPLMKLESNPKLEERYRIGLNGLWRRVRFEENPLWFVLDAAAAGRQGSAARQEARRALQRIPLDTISWTVRNSQRADLKMDSAPGRFDEKQSSRAIAPNERRVMKWNGNPFQLDGGDGGRSEDDGAFFLLPYWMGFYLGLLGA